MTGMPCSNPRGAPARRSASLVSASPSALRLVTLIAFSAGPFWSYASMRARYIETKSCDVTVPSVSAAWSCGTVASSKSICPVGIAAPPCGGSFSANNVDRPANAMPRSRVLGHCRAVLIPLSRKLT